MNVRTAGVLFSATLFSCSPPVPDIPSAAPTVTRVEALRTSRAYTDLAWRGTRRNIRHGTDPEGIRIDTPDASSSGTHAGAWWKPGTRSAGMPYKWGGFDTPRQLSLIHI